MTLNIEVVKSNLNYLRDIAKDHNLIICLQEHWLWGYETNFFEKHFPLHSICSRSHDDNDPIPNFKARRGQAGIAIMWPTSLNKFIHKLPDSNSRVMAIKIELENHTEKKTEQFKSGIVTQVCKKGKDGKILDSYCGITVSSVLGKLFEHALLEKVIDQISNVLSQQFGFTSGLSPTMAALLISEAHVNAKRMKEILFLTALDTQKAFDVVNHSILLDKLFQKDIPPEIWETIYEMYNDLTSRVNWKGPPSNSFPVQQGVRQGGIRPTHLYKIFIEDLLKQLEDSNIGLYLGTNYTGCPTCADDILLLSNSDEEMQIMLNVVDTYSKEHQYNIYPEKSLLIK
ncbi:unnamed protein product [Mytilus coruscus]|uniref:Reverse transcriptase domain-containing protein n=1 Tax=Mytilus coruscus TaxID=42192 RepID=A0A6J8CBF9_MYTCO|nr:unnamed protein product [Mytilus coruscus]